MRTNVLVMASVLLGGCDKSGETAAPTDAGPASAEPSDEGPRGEPEPEPKIDASVRIEGALTEEQVRAVVQKHFDDVRACFDEAMARMEMGEMTGVIAVDITVDKSGSVTVAQVADSSFGDATAEGCIVESAKSWAFPRLNKGASAKVRYPFQLRSY